MNLNIPMLNDFELVSLLGEFSICRKYNVAQNQSQ